MTDPRALPRDCPEIWVLRHGQTTWNVEERLQGHLDSPLTDLGLEQARAQGEILRGALPPGVRVLVSPSGRAWRTAEIALAGLGLEIEPDPDLREICLGDWQGRLIADLRDRIGTAALRDPHLWKFGAPNGESLVAMTERVTRVLDRLTGPTVLITHGVTSRLLRCVALGHPAENLSALPGGQGVVHHLKDGRARVLTV